MYRVQPSGNEQLDLLAALNDEHFEFWSPLRKDVVPVYMMVEAQAKEIFQNLLVENKIPYEILINNVERKVQKERIFQMITPCVSEDQPTQDYPNQVSLGPTRKSNERRDIKLIKISTNPSANEPIIFIDAGIHTREWATPPAALYAINQLVENVNLLEKVDFHILLVVNPDG